MKRHVSQFSHEQVKIKITRLIIPDSLLFFRMERLSFFGNSDNDKKRPTVPCWS